MVAIISSYITREKNYIVRYDRHYKMSNGTDKWSCYYWTGEEFVSESLVFEIADGPRGYLHMKDCRDAFQDVIERERRGRRTLDLRYDDSGNHVEGYSGDTLLYRWGFTTRSPQSRKPSVDMFSRRNASPYTWEGTIDLT